MSVVANMPPPEASTNGRNGEQRFLRKLAENFHTLGVVVVPDFLSELEVQALRADCDTLLERVDRKSLVENYGCVLEPREHFSDESSSSTTTTTTTTSTSSFLGTVGDTLRTRHDYAILRQAAGLQEATTSILFSDKLLKIVQLLIGAAPGDSPIGDGAWRGDNGCCYLFNENFILKPSQHDGSAFSWHQDAESISDQIKGNEYLSVWFAVDDMTKENGCLVVPANGGRIPAKAIPTAKTVPLTVRAGSMVVMAQDSWHFSLPNRSQSYRRAWMPQYSKYPTSGISMAVKCLPVTNAANRHDPGESPKKVANRAR